MPPDDDDFDPRMTVGEHLEALRGHILKAIIYIALIAVVCFVFQKDLMNWATWPHQRVQGKLIQEAKVKLAPPELQGLVGEVDEGAKALDQALAKAGREVAAARNKLEPTEGRLEAVKADQAALLKEAEALVERAEALAKQDPPSAESLAALQRDRAALIQRRAALKAKVDDAAGPFIDKFAKLPRFELAAIKYQEPFLSYLKLAIVAAIFLASPLVVWELWKFVGVGLYPHEKRHLRLFAPLSLFMFILGGLFGYFVLIPIGLYFLATYAPPDLVTGTFSMGAYLSLFITMTVVVGMVFQLPLVMSFLTLIGVLSHTQFREYRGYAWLGGAVAAAVLTPPDPFTQMLLLGPMGVLYEIGIFASMLIGDRRKQAEEEIEKTLSEARKKAGIPDPPRPDASDEAGTPAQLPGGPSSSADRPELLEDIEDPPGYDPDAEPEDDPDDPDIEIQPAPGAVAQGALDDNDDPTAVDDEDEEPASDAPYRGPEATDPAPYDDNEDPTATDDEDEGPVSDAPYRGPEAVDPTPHDDNEDPTATDDEDEGPVSDAPYRGPEAVDPDTPDDDGSTATNDDEDAAPAPPAEEPASPPAEDPPSPKGQDQS